MHNKFNSQQDNEIIKKEVRYITLPFQGHYSYFIRNKLQKLLGSYLPDISFRFIFTNSLTIGSYFKYKDRIPNVMCSNVVYEYTCPVCKARYIGSTCRNLTIRIAEHKGFSFRTGKQLANPNASMIRDHSRRQDHLIRDEAFKILFKANNKFELRIAETLNIIESKPTLNSNDTAIKLNLM